MPTVAYRQVETYITTERAWYRASAKSGKPAWTYVIGATGLPFGHIGVPIIIDNKVKAVALHQIEFGTGSVVSGLLKSFVNDDKNLFLYIVNAEGGLLATSGDDKGYYFSDGKTDDGSLKMVLDYANAFSQNPMIQTTAKVTWNKFGFPGTYTAGKYNVAVYPLNVERTENIGWSVVAVSEKYPLGRTKKYEACKARRLIGSERALAAKAPCLKTNEDGSKCVLSETSDSTSTKSGLGGGWVAVIVIGSLAFIGGLIYAGSKFTGNSEDKSVKNKRSFMNPVFALGRPSLQELPAIGVQTQT